MKKYVLIMFSLLLALCVVGYKNNDAVAMNFVQDFADSVAFDNSTGTLSFTIPKNLSSKFSLYLHISGRTKMGNGEMSFHLFEEESESNSWEQGKAYSYEFGKDAIVETLIYIKLENDANSEVLCETEIDIDPKGNINRTDFPERVENKICLSASQKQSSLQQQIPESKDIIASKQKILDSLETKAEIEYNGEYEIEGSDCYCYSVYIEMAQDDGNQLNYAPRLVGLYAITKNGDTIFTSIDGVEWETWSEP